MDSRLSTFGLDAAGSLVGRILGLVDDVPGPSATNAFDAIVLGLNVAQTCFLAWLAAQAHRR